MTIHAVINAKKNWHVERCDVLEGLRMLPDRCVNAVVTSPPYYALRSYLPADHEEKGKEHGSEPTPEAFIATMVEVFEEVRRVLRDDGVVWMNLGDSYNAGTSSSRKSSGNGSDVGYWQDAGDMGDKRVKVDALKTGDKLNMPHRVAEALQAAGWWWRDTVVWHKKSPMPESVSGWKWVRCRVKVANGSVSRRVKAGVPEVELAISEKNGHTLAEWSPCPGCPKCLPNNGLVLRRGRWRCTQAHEYVFMFAKSDEYFCDGEAGKVKASDNTHSKGTKHRTPKTDDFGNGVRNNESFADATWETMETANPRNVLSLSHEPTKEKHFAAYPTELVRFCLLPSLAHAYCAECGAPHAPIVEEERKATRPALTNKIWKHDDGDSVGQRSDDSPNLDPERHIKCSTVVGYKATCSCNAGTTTGLVMDPYCGTGTTGEVALKLGARFIAFELNPEYKRMADRRVRTKLPLFT